MSNLLEIKMRYSKKTKQQQQQIGYFPENWLKENKLNQGSVTSEEQKFQKEKMEKEIQEVFPKWQDFSFQV